MHKSACEKFKSRGTVDVVLSLIVGKSMFATITCEKR